MGVGGLGQFMAGMWEFACGNVRGRPQLPCLSLLMTVFHTDVRCHGFLSLRGLLDLLWFNLLAQLGYPRRFRSRSRGAWQRYWHLRTYLTIDRWSRRLTP